MLVQCWSSIGPVLVQCWSSIGPVLVQCLAPTQLQTLQQVQLDVLVQLYGVMRNLFRVRQVLILVVLEHVGRNDAAAVPLSVMVDRALQIARKGKNVDFLVILAIVLSVDQAFQNGVVRLVGQPAVSRCPVFKQLFGLNGVFDCFSRQLSLPSEFAESWFYRRFLSTLPSCPRALSRLGRSPSFPGSCSMSMPSFTTSRGKAGVVKMDIVCLFVCLFVCLLVCLFVCLLACLFVCLFVCLLVCLFVCLLVCLWFRGSGGFGDVGFRKV